MSNKYQTRRSIYDMLTDERKEKVKKRYAAYKQKQVLDNGIRVAALDEPEKIHTQAEDHSYINQIIRELWKEQEKTK